MADSTTALAALWASVFADNFASATCFNSVVFESSALKASKACAASFFYAGVPTFKTFSYFFWAFAI